MMLMQLIFFAATSAINEAVGEAPQELHTVQATWLVVLEAWGCQVSFIERDLRPYVVPKMRLWPPVTRCQPRLSDLFYCDIMDVAFWLHIIGSSPDHIHKQ